MRECGGMIWCRQLTGTSQLEAAHNGGLIPLTDASRRPVNFAIVTISIIVINFVVFGLELKGGSAFDHYDIVSEMDLTDRARRIEQ